MKKVTKAGLIVAGLGLVFVAGSFTGKNTGANGDWVTTGINNAYSELITTANEVSNALTSNVEDDANAKVQAEIQQSVDEKQAELEKLLEEYYQMKLDGLTETEQFLQLESQVAAIQQDLLNTFKQRIDEEFNRVSGEQTTP